MIFRGLSMEKPKMANERKFTVVGRGWNEEKVKHNEENHSVEVVARSWEEAEHDGKKLIHEKYKKQLVEVMTIEKHKE